MSSRPLAIAALAAAVLAAPASAGAGSPCCCSDPCVAPAPVMHVYRPYEIPRIYIVNQGPVYSGPGIFTAPLVVGSPPMADYPYFSHGYRYYVPRKHRRPIRVRY
jgi:hypothetical protein